MQGDANKLFKNSTGLISIVVLLLCAPLGVEAQVKTHLSDTSDIVDAKEARKNFNSTSDQTSSFTTQTGVATSSEEDFFDTQYFFGGFDGNILASHEHDGELYIGGWFNAFNDKIISSIARWNGSTWEKVGDGLYSQVNALISFEGDLIAGGWFRDGYNYIARWDGSSWQPMGDGFDNAVEALTVYDGQLIAGGNFTRSGSKEVYHLAKWDGDSWQPVGKGVDGTVEALEVIDEGLVVGGTFSRHGISNSLDSDKFTGTYQIVQEEKSTAIADFDGGWLFEGAQEFEVELNNNEAPFTDDRTFTATPLGGEFPNNEGEFSLVFNAEDNTVHFPQQEIGITCNDGIFYGPAETISGSFDPDDDSEFTFGITDDITEDCGESDEVIFTATKTSSGTGGIASSSAGNEVNNIALWDGSSWQSMGDGLNNTVQTLLEYDGTLYAGGYFTHSGTQTRNLIAQWDGSSWQSVGNGLGGERVSNNQDRRQILGIYDLIESNNGLVAAGAFTATGDDASDLNAVALWNGSDWENLGQGLDQSLVFSGTIYDDNLFIGSGDIRYPPYRTIAATYENDDWTVKGEFEQGLGANVQAAGLFVDDETIYLGGRFSRVGDEVVRSVAKYTPSDGWEAMGDGLDAFIRRMHVYEETPLAAGNMFSFDDGSQSAIAEWDGSSWSPMGSGINGSVWRFIEYEGSLIIGGFFYEQNDNPASGIARWDGSDWQKIGDGLQQNAQVFALAEFENDLIVGGAFLQDDENLARWDGSQWHSFSSQGLDNPLEITSMTVHNGELYVSYITENIHHYVAKWDQENSSWNNIGNPFLDTIFDLESHGGDLYAMAFQNTPIPEINGGFVKWTGSEWTSVGEQPLNGGGHSLASNNEGIYFAGHFTAAGGIPSSSIGFWDTNLETFVASPSSVSIDEDDSSLNLIWDAPSIGDVEEYKIYSGSSINELSHLTTLDAGTQSHSISELPDGTAFYAVKAADGAGNESRFSNVVSYHNSDKVISDNWELISFPIEDAEVELSQGQAFAYSGNYQGENTLESAQGYWVRSDDQVSIDVQGKGLQNTTIVLNEGWNLIGGLADNSKVSSFGDPSEILTEAPVYRYTEGAYEEVSSISGSEGYWIYADDEGSISMSITGNPAASEDGTEQRIIAGSDSKLDNDTKTDKITFTAGDADQNIWITQSNLSREQKYRFVMPPPAPQPRIDIRTHDGYKIIEGGSEEIELTVSSYPVTVELAETENNSDTRYKIVARDNGEEKTINLTPNEKKTINKEYEKLTLEKVNSDKEIVENKMSDNYPNPFNPATNISYQIAEQADVNMSVYNITGQKVATLVDAQKQPGEYTVRFDASKLASGVYFVRLKAGSFTEIQKLTLIK